MAADDICPSCGWHKDRFGHSRRCWPAAGKAAKRFMLYCKQVGIEATQLGYGDHCVAAKFPNGMTIVFEISEHGQDFEVRHTFGMAFDDNGVGKLISLLATLVESEKKPMLQPPTVTRGYWRDWEFGFDSIDVAPDDFARRALPIAVSHFSPAEIIVTPRIPAGKMSSNGTRADVSVFQLIVDGEPVLIKRLMPRSPNHATDAHGSWNYAVNSVMSHSTIEIVLHNAGSVVRRVDVRVKGKAAI